MFRSISATNFFSWKSLEFNFQTGVTLISGDNLDDGTSEGAGKSSIPNALCWGLYGQLPKDTNIDDVIKTGEKSCCVVITLDNGTEIVRARKPNELAIQLPNGDDYQAGDIIQGKDAKETQKMINDLIGMSFDTFCQSVYFAQNYSNKFITATQENKAKILSELQDLSIFDKASKKSAEHAKESKITLAQLTMERGYAANALEMAKAELKTFEQLSQGYEQKRMIQLEEIAAKSYSINVKIKEIEVELKNLTDLHSLTDKQNEANEVQRQLIECHSQLYHIDMIRRNAIDNTNCTACGQRLPNREHITIPDDTELQNKYANLLKLKSEIDVELNDLINKKNQNSLLDERLTNLEAQKTQINKEIEQLENTSNPYLTKIEELSINKHKLSTKLDTINHKINEQTKLQNQFEYLKDGFKEIKSYVFQSLLSELNRNTNKYLSELFEIPAFITFDNVSDDGDISKIKTTVILDGYERSLGLLSGGQFRRVQLAVDFALSDIVAQRSKNPINIRILDEAFKDLSEQSMERVVGVLQKMKGSTVLIEHNSIVKNIVTRVFKVQLKDGISTHE